MLSLRNRSELEHRSSSRLHNYSLDGVWLDLRISETRWDKQQGIVLICVACRSIWGSSVLIGKKCGLNNGITFN